MGSTQDDVRRIAMALPGTIEEAGRFSFGIPNGKTTKAFAWVWLERVHPKQARVPQPAVLAVRVPSLADKELLLAGGNDAIFTEPHYNGFPAILVRLADIDVDELAELLTDGWRCQAPKKLVAQFDAEHPGED